jgi:sarcosine oxidase subunit beta
MQVVIIGGGIVGLASAYYLAGRDVGVTVCERSHIGAGSTARSGGGIRAQFSEPENIRLSKHSIEVWERFEDEFGVDIQYRRTGYLFLARESETAEQLARNVERQNELGVPSEYLSPAEASEVCPRLYAEQFEAATYSPTDGIAMPYLALQGFVDAVANRGVDIRTDTEITGVTRTEPREGRDSGRITGVKTTDGTISTDYVVNATGPWAREVLSRFDVELPVRPQRRQVAKVEPDVALSDPIPLTVDLDSGVFIRPEQDEIGVGGKFGEPEFVDDPNVYSERLDLDWAEEAMEHATDVSGLITLDSQIKDVRTGLYCVTPDHNPIIEETVPGLINAIGFSGHGFMHAPAVGQIVADLVADGDTDVVDLSSFSSERFGTDASAEMNFI